MTNQQAREQVEKGKGGEAKPEGIFPLQLKWFRFLTSNEIPGFYFRLFLLGYRMACPQRCPDDVYKVMQRCWQYNPEDRPKFSELQRDLAAVKKK